LARLPEAVVFVPDDGEEAREMIWACLACDGAMELLGGVGSRLADPRATPWPPFVLVASRGPELVAVVHGPVEVVVEREGDEERLYGGDEVGSWLNKALPQAQALRAGAGARPDGPVDLREGVVRAAGFLLVPRGHPTAGALAGPAKEESMTVAGPSSFDRASFDRASLDRASLDRTGFDRTGFDRTGLDRAGVDGDATVVERPGAAVKGLELAAGAERELRHAHGPALVRGVCCPRMHLNDPRAPTCRLCGLPIVAGAAHVEGLRPPLGRLTWDNGEMDPLPGAVLVGREVGLDAAVVAGELAPLVPSGPNDSMSRVHAELRPSGWDVVVIDRASTNGTFVWDEASRAWQRLTPGEAHVLQAGAVLAFGERTATFEPTDMPAA
jgi:hypothetical protein